MTERIVVEGSSQVGRQLKAIGGPELRKQLGQVHRQVGEVVIRRAGGPRTGVGSGAGATIRPSAATREVILRVGGKHRAARGRWRQWGKRVIWPPPSRPFLIGAANDAEAEILQTYFDGVRRVAAPLKIES